MDTLLPAGPHLSNGCFQRRAWETSGAAGQQGGGHRWEGTALALREGGGYGTVEQQAVYNRKYWFYFLDHKKNKVFRKKEKKSFSSSYADY
jgi:hypothetical protein